MRLDRRSFLKGTGSAGLLLNAHPDLLTSAARAATAPGGWDTGAVRHILPTVSDTRILIKASFAQPMMQAPVLRIDGMSVRGDMTDTRGEFWQFNVSGLRPGRTYRLALTGVRGRPLCEPWPLSTFPAPDEKPSRFRVLFLSCVGGHEAMKFLPPAVRNRLLRRALSLKPDAAVANGDHLYWDLLSPNTAKTYGQSADAIRIAGKFDRAGVVLGGDNEGVLRRVADPQIVSVYGADFRSTPVFFLMDDHDYFDNDDAFDEIITFPPSHFMLQLGRATQHMYYPEFLPDRSRPAGLAWSSMADRPNGVSESFGTIRYGRLAEVLLYDIRRTATLAGPSAVYIDSEAERWLAARMADPDVSHVVHAPSNPPGWTAGKWGEWYPDVLGPDKKLTLKTAKPYWQPGWLKQHDRILTAMSAMKGRAPLVVSGDMHAIALGKMLRSGSHDFSANPVTVCLSGTGGTRPLGWPSAGFRGTPAMPSLVLDFIEEVKPLELHGFTMVDFLPDKMIIQQFKWDVKSQTVEDIDTLQPFHTAELPRPV